MTSRIFYCALFLIPLLARPSFANCIGYSGPGGPCYSGPGGGLYTGPGGGAYTGPGGGAYTGPGGGAIPAPVVVEQISGIDPTQTANKKQFLLL